MLIPLALMTPKVKSGLKEAMCLENTKKRNTCKFTDAISWPEL